MLVFNTAEVYENTISNLNNPSTYDELNQINKSKFQVTKSEQELYPDFLSTILNSDKMVQIGNWIIKVDLQKNALSVTNSVNTHLIEKIKANESDNEIYYFSTNDDVLDLLEQGSKGTLKSIQKIKATPNNVWKRYYYHDGSNTEVQVRYYRAGVYFSLFSATQTNGAYAGQEASYITMTASYKYKSKKRKAKEVTGAAEVSRRRALTSKYYRRHYNSTRGLKYYNLSTSFTLEFYDFFGNYITKQSITLDING